MCVGLFHQLVEVSAAPSVVADSQVVRVPALKPRALHDVLWSIVSRSDFNTYSQTLEINRQSLECSEV